MNASFPRRCIVELHYRCNLRCQTCNIWKTAFSRKRLGKNPNRFNDWLVIQKRLARSGITQIAYVGGEPLLVNDIFDLIGDTCNQGLSVVLVTNGSLFTPDSLGKLLASGVHTVIFSLDGTADVHDSIRGKKGTFERVIQSIGHLQRAKKANKRKKPRVSIYMTISKLNLNTIPAMLDIARKLDVNSIRFQLISVITERISLQVKEVFQRDVVGYHSYAVGTGLKPNNSDLRAIRDMLEGAKHWSVETGIGLQLENVLLSPKARCGCDFIKSSFVINPCGEVIPCPMLPGYSIGNILKTELDSLWGNEAHAGFINLLNEAGRLAVCGECCVEKT